MGADFYLAPAVFSYSTKCPKIAVANSLFFKIAGAKAPIAPILNRPLNLVRIICPLPIEILYAKIWVIPPVPLLLRQPS